MSDFQQIKDELSFVALGAFNPTIFHPEWFYRHELISEAESQNVDIELIHPDVAKFESSWFALEVVQNRLVLRSLNVARSDELRDLAANIFTVLPETPVNAAGFNRMFEFACSTEELWHAVGHALSPKEQWSKAFPGVDPNREIGTRNLEVEIQRVDDIPGVIRITMFPSGSPPSPKVSFRVNNHVEIAQFLEGREGESLSSVIVSYWDQYMDGARGAVDGLLKEINNAG